MDRRRGDDIHPSLCLRTGQGGGQRIWANTNIHTHTQVCRCMGVCRQLWGREEWGWWGPAMEQVLAISRPSAPLSPVCLHTFTLASTGLHRSPIWSHSASFRGSIMTINIKNKLQCEHCRKTNIRCTKGIYNNFDNTSF